MVGMLSNGSILLVGIIKLIKISITNSWMYWFFILKGIIKLKHTKIYLNPIFS
jgi:hypothetical protein